MKEEITPSECPHCGKKYLRTWQSEYHFECGTTMLANTFSGFSYRSELCEERGRSKSANLRGDYWTDEASKFAGQLATAAKQRDEAIRIAEEAITPLARSEYHMDATYLHERIEKLKKEIEA